MSQTKQRRWTKQFILKTLENNGFHPVDVQFGNGYFIFDHGKDMVVHFHIKELKGWKFGVWWHVDGEKRFDFFTQYERDIDKFKPSASTLVLNDVMVEDWYMKDLVNMCRFIKKHPYRAWKLDNTYVDQVWEWDDLNGAFKEYVKDWWRLSVREPHIQKKMTKRYLRILNEICCSLLDNYEIVDDNKDGWVCYPRYTVVCDGVIGEDLEKGRSYNIKLKAELPDWLMDWVDRYNNKFSRLSEKGYDLYDIHLGDYLPFVIRKEKKNDAKQSLCKDDKAVVPSRTKSKQSTGKKKSTGKVQQETKASKSTKE